MVVCCSSDRFSCVKTISLRGVIDCSFCCCFSSTIPWYLQAPETMLSLELVNEHQRAGERRKQHKAGTKCFDQVHPSCQCCVDAAMLSLVVLVGCFSDAMLCGVADGTSSNGGSRPARGAVPDLQRLQS
jgi:hypothetical protein